jgi:hypothetical protein
MVVAGGQDDAFDILIVFDNIHVVIFRHHVGRFSGSDSDLNE